MKLMAAAALSLTGTLAMAENPIDTIRPDAPELAHYGSYPVGTVTREFVNPDQVDVVNTGAEGDIAHATAERQAAILDMQDKGEISGGQAKEIFEIVLKTGREPGEIAEAEGLKQVSDTGAIEEAIDAIIAGNADKVEEYRGGKDKLFGFFVGQTMKAMQGKANPAVVNQILKDKLD